MLYFLRTPLNEAYTANVPFAKSVRASICCPEFYSSLKISSDFAFFMSRETISHFLKFFCGNTRYAFYSKYTVQFLRLYRVESFLRLHGLCTKWKIFFTGSKSFLTLQISVAKICGFPWRILTDLSLFSKSSKERFVLSL